MPESHLSIGALLKEWRACRGVSQLELALEASISARHLSCVETGKAKASREVVSRLADALCMPLRERNALMLAAGYAPEFTETPLAKPTLDRMREAIGLIIKHQEPYPAFVINRHWDVLFTNEAAIRVNSFLTHGRPPKHTNLLHQIFDPEDFRRLFSNWPEVAGRFIRHLHHDIAAVPSDPIPRKLLDQILSYPDVPARWRFHDLEPVTSPILRIAFHTPLGELRFFETITTFAGPGDVTLDEIRIECSFPADDWTAEFCAKLARGEVSTIGQAEMNCRGWI